MSSTDEGKRMRASDVTKAGVVGAGTMGTGIAQLVASRGMEVVLLDVEKGTAEKAVRGLEKSLGRLADKGKIDGDAARKTVAGIRPTADYGDLGGAEVAIEAVSENMAVKKAVFSRIEESVAETAVVATNTSTLSVTELAAGLRRPQRVVGIHFFNPAPVMKLVEIVKTQKTSAATLDFAMEFARKLGKRPVVARDRAGFVVNRILLPMINEAVFALDEGVARAEEIDEAMKLGANHPMGPLALADLIGLDVVEDILDALYREFGDPKFRAAPLLRETVRAGSLGRKTGKGFFEYDRQGRR